MIFFYKKEQNKIELVHRLGAEAALPRPAAQLTLRLASHGWQGRAWGWPRIDQI